MPAVVEEVRVYKVEYRCDHCNEGYVKPTGYTRLSQSNSIEHECCVCGASTYLGETYPRITYQPINNQF